jgi:hypothetical protein
VKEILKQLNLLRSLFQFNSEQYYLLTIRSLVPVPMKDGPVPHCNYINAVGPFSKQFHSKRRYHEGLMLNSHASFHFYGTSFICRASNAIITFVSGLGSMFYWQQYAVTVITVAVKYGNSSCVIVTATPRRRMGRGGKAPYILKLSTMWKCVVCFTPLPLYPRENAP